MAPFCWVSGLVPGLGTEVCGCAPAEATDSPRSCSVRSWMRPAAPARRTGAATHRSVHPDRQQEARHARWLLGHGARYDVSEGQRRDIPAVTAIAGLHAEGAPQALAHTEHGPAEVGRVDLRGARTQLLGQRDGALPELVGVCEHMLGEQCGVDVGARRVLERHLPQRELAAAHLHVELAHFPGIQRARFSPASTRTRSGSAFARTSRARAAEFLWRSPRRSRANRALARRAPTVPGSASSGRGSRRSASCSRARPAPDRGRCR